MKPIYLLLFFCSTSIFLIACDPDDDIIINTAQEEADRIRANTPIDLPPITTTGENTMGAWIIPQSGSELALAAGTDSILFVASGVERIDPIGSSSTDCNAFQNFRYESQDFVSVLGYWCPRPEIGDPKSQTLGFDLSDQGYAIMFYASNPLGGSSINQFIFISDTIRPPMYTVLRNDSDNRVLSITMDSISLIGTRNTANNVKLFDLRIDATYGSTP